MKEVESLIIYKAVLDMIYYSETLLTNFYKIERNLLVKDIRTINFDIMSLILRVHKEKIKSQKNYYLNEIDINLKMLKVYVRLSFKKRYINSKNYGIWDRKITNISNMVFNWSSNI